MSLIENLRNERLVLLALRVLGTIFPSRQVLELVLRLLARRVGGFGASEVASARSSDADTAAAQDEFSHLVQLYPAAYVKFMQVGAPRLFKAFLCTDAEDFQGQIGSPKSGKFNLKFDAAKYADISKASEHGMQDILGMSLRNLGDLDRDHPTK